MQVKLVHRNDLRVTSTSSSTLDTERRSLRRLSNASEGGFSEVSSERLGETDRGGRFTFSERSRRDTGDNDVFTVSASRFQKSLRRNAKSCSLSMLEGVEKLKLDLGLVFAVHLEIVGGNSNLSGENVDRFGSLRFGDFDVTANLASDDIPMEGRRSSPRNVLLERKFESFDDSLLRFVEMSLSSDERILHEHSDSHRSDSSRDGSDERGDLDGRVVVYISDETLTRFSRRICDASVSAGWRRRAEDVPAMKLVPTSMTTAPGLSQDPLTKRGCPIAATTISACLICDVANQLQDYDWKRRHAREPPSFAFGSDIE